jgi:hypothetical protein
MSEAFRDISPDARSCSRLLAGCLPNTPPATATIFPRCGSGVDEWYLPPQGLFIVLEREGEIIATGAYKPKDRHTAEIKRIWTHRRLRQQGLAAKVVRSWSGGRCWPGTAIST